MGGAMRHVLRKGGPVCLGGASKAGSIQDLPKLCSTTLASGGAGFATVTSLSTLSRWTRIATSTVVASNADPRSRELGNGVEGVAWHSTATRIAINPSRKINLCRFSSDTWRR